MDIDADEQYGRGERLGDDEFRLCLRYGRQPIFCCGRWEYLAKESIALALEEPNVRAQFSYTCLTKGKAFAFHQHINNNFEKF